MESLPSVRKVSQALKRRRKKLGLSLRQAASESGVTHSVLHRLESNPTVRIHVENLNKVIRWLMRQQAA